MGVREDLQRVGINLDLQRPRVARVLRYIASYYRLALTVDSIVAVSGYAERGLQDALKRAIGVSSMQLIILLRLEEAHAILEDGVGVESVHEVADRVGFAHKGRFSVRYRERFGEVPSETLRRSRARIIPGPGTRSASEFEAGTPGNGA